MTSRLRFAVPLTFALIIFGVCLASALGPRFTSAGLSMEPAVIQNRPEPLLTVDDKVKLLTARLNLSQDQQTTIRGILEDQHAQARAIGADQALSPENKMDKLKGVNETAVSKINDVLHNNQKDEFGNVSDEMRVHIGKGHGSGYGRGSGSGHGSGMSIDDQVTLLSSKLPLTAEQQAAAKLVFEDQHAQNQAIWKDSSLSSQSREDKLHALGETGVAKIRVLLTAEQQKAFDASQPEMFEIIARGNNRSGIKLH